MTSLPGPVRLWPYQREIADAIGDPTIERVTLVKSVRVGFTTLLTGAIGSYVVNEPAPILALLPTESDCRDYVVSDIEPIFEASPCLRNVISIEADESGRNTIMHRRFPGGSLKVVPARSPRNLRRHTVRVLLIDEADGMEVSKEGPPILLAEKRTLSYADRKIIIGSTPVYEDGPVLRSYADSDRRVFEVPCPDCGDRTEILWRHIKWDEGQPDTARFKCPHCEAEIAERHKVEMVEKGLWRATRPEVQGHAGFRLNALVSLLANASWGKLAAEFLIAKNDSEDLKVFTNTILAEGWKEQGEEIDEDALAERAENFSLNDIPADVLIVTVGVDVQDDRLEASVVGWSRTEAYALGHQVIWGSPDDDDTWVELEDLLRMRWKHPLGGELKVDAAAIDSGDGDWTDKVYAFCFPRMKRRVWAIKGAGGNRPGFEVSNSKVKGGRIAIVGVDNVKTTVLSRLSRGHGIRFSSELQPVYYEQLASERKVVRYHRGQPVRRFERKPGARAEALDCLVYAFAVRSGLNVNFDHREAELTVVPSAAPPDPTPQLQKYRPRPVTAPHPYA